MRNDIGPAVNTIGGWIGSLSRFLAGFCLLLIAIAIVAYLVEDRVYDPWIGEAHGFITYIWQTVCLLIAILAVGRLLGGLVQVAGFSMMSKGTKLGIIHTADDHGVLIQDVMDAMKEQRKAERQEKFKDVA